MSAPTTIAPDKEPVSHIHILNHRRQASQDTFVSRQRRVGSVVERVTSNDKVQGSIP